MIFTDVCRYIQYPQLIQQTYEDSFEFYIVNKPINTDTNKTKCLSLNLK